VKKYTIQIAPLLGEKMNLAQPSSLTLIVSSTGR
jgi:hypothetical protein